MALPANAYLYEFLYRGQPTGSAQAPSWHVILAAPQADGFGGATLTLSPAMTPEQAATAGFALPDTLAGINAAALAELTAARAELATTKAALAAGQAVSRPTPAA